MLTLYINQKQFTLMASLPWKSKVKWYSFSFSFEAFNAAICAEHLKAFIKENRLTGCPVILAISMDHIISREVVWDKPFLDWEAYRSIQKNFDQYFPGTLSDEFCLDFEKVNLNEGNLEPLFKLKIYAAPTRLLEPYIAMTECSGLKIAALDIDALALGLVFRNWVDQPSHSLKIGIVFEGMSAWLIEYMSKGIVRLKETLLIPDEIKEFLNFFQAFAGENIWELSQALYMGNSPMLLAILDSLKSRFAIQAYPLDLLRSYKFLSDLTGFLAESPLSVAVHCGLRERHGY